MKNIWFALWQYGTVLTACPRGMCAKYVGIKCSIDINSKLVVLCFIEHIDYTVTQGTDLGRLMTGVPGTNVEALDGGVWATGDTKLKCSREKEKEVLVFSHAGLGSSSQCQPSACEKTKTSFSFSRKYRSWLLKKKNYWLSKKKSREYVSMAV